MPVRWKSKSGRRGRVAASTADWTASLVATYTVPGTFLGRIQGLIYDWTASIAGVSQTSSSVSGTIATTLAPWTAAIYGGEDLATSWTDGLGDSFNVEPGEPFTYTFTATDVDGDAIEFVYDPLPVDSPLVITEHPQVGTTRQLTISSDGTGLVAASSYAVVLALSTDGGAAMSPRGLVFVAPGVFAGLFEPAITGEEQPVQYIPSDAGDGPGWSTSMNRATWNRHLGLFWSGTFSSTSGDFVDANGTANGSTPFATIPVPAATVGTYASASGSGVTNLVQRALTNGNKGFYLKTVGSSSQAQVQGRLAANPPLLSVTTTTGTFNNLPCRGFANWYNAGASVNPRDSTLAVNLGTSRYGHLSFDLSSVTGTVTAATISLYVNSQATTNPSIGLWECNPPSFFLGAGSSSPSLTDPVSGQSSLAAVYPGDAGMDADPDVVYAGDFTGTTIDFATGVANSPKIGRIAFPANDATAAPALVTSSTDLAISAGSTAWKGTFAPVFTDSGPRRTATVIRGHSMRPVFSSPYSIDISTLEEDLYFRMYLKLDDNFLYETEGNKMAITWDCRFGYWSLDPSRPLGGYWFATTGNGGDPGDGFAFTDTTTIANETRTHYRGNMFRMESGSVPSANSPYRDMRPWIGYNYQTPPNQSPQTNAGVTHYTGLANGKFRRGVWYCIEQRLRLNTVDGPYDDLGNGTGVADGLVETWSNGVKIDSQGGWLIRQNKNIGIAGAGTEWYMGGKGDMPLTMNFYVNHLACARRYIGPRVKP